MNIHFICRGNVLRSLMAETYTRSLNLKNVNVISSGTIANWDDAQEREYFANTLEVLARHGIRSFAKPKAEKLTQSRINSHHDIVILMNQRVVNDVLQMVNLPNGFLNWDIVDVGEGDRTDMKNLEIYQEEIYQEIKQKVNDLLL